MSAALNPVVLIAGANILAAAGAGALLLVDQRARASNRRIAGVVAAYAPAGYAPNGRRWAQGADAVAGPSRALAFLAIRSDRPDLYPLPWWAITVATTLLAAAIQGVLQFFLGPLAWVALPVTWFMITRGVFRYFQTRRATVLYLQLPDALGMIVRSVRVGLTVQDSLRIVGEECQWPTSLEFRQLNDEIRVGSLLPDGLLRLAQRSGLIEYRFFAVALALQSQSGGGLSETLDNLADVVRKRVALKARAIALASEARMTMYVLAALPFFASGALLVINPDYLMVLVTTAMGKNLLFAGILLLTMGIGSMQVIIKKSVS